MASVDVPVALLGYGTVIVRGWTNITGTSCEEVERDDHGNRIA